MRSSGIPCQQPHFDSPTHYTCPMACLCPRLRCCDGQAPQHTENNSRIAPTPTRAPPSMAANLAAFITISSKPRSTLASIEEALLEHKPVCLVAYDSSFRHKSARRTQSPTDRAPCPPHYVILLLAHPRDPSAPHTSSSSFWDLSGTPWHPPSTTAERYPSLTALV